MTTSEPLAYQEIEDGLLEAMERQEKLTEEYADASDHQAEQEVAYKKAAARAWVTLKHDASAVGRKMTERDLESQVTIDVADELEGYLFAQSRVKSTAEALRTVRARIDILRSLMTSHRSVTG